MTFTFGSVCSGIEVRWIGRRIQIMEDIVLEGPLEAAE